MSVPHVLAKCDSKFDCLIEEVPNIDKFDLNQASRLTVFTQRFLPKDVEELLFLYANDEETSK